MGLPIERPLTIYPGRSGGGLYKLKSDSQLVELGLLMILNQVQEYQRKQYKQYLFLKNIIIYQLAYRCGFRIPLISFNYLMEKDCEN
ncbi:hypothetical protein JCM14036_19800 [Desulfotomaculum defluvii]